MRTEQDYHSLTAEINAVAKRHGNVYLTDGGVDAENCLPLSWDDGEVFWNAMYSALCNSAGMRAEELGLDLNKELGRVIY